MVKKGEWYVDDIGEFWYIRKKGTTQKKKIGKVAMRGTNYYDKACAEAEKRNRKL